MKVGQKLSQNSNNRIETWFVYIVTNYDYNWFVFIYRCFLFSCIYMFYYSRISLSSSTYNHPTKKKTCFKTLLTLLVRIWSQVEVMNL